MSIKIIKETDFNQNLSINPEAKLLYGEILTPFSLIDDMLDMLPENVFSDPNKKWLDAGAGTGFFSMKLYWKLYNGLDGVIKNKEQRHNHIIEHMLHLSELRDENILKLREIFGENANIFAGNFLELKGNYDYIIGNPPYNCNGIKKVPTNNKLSKKRDGQTIWIAFVRHSIKLLRNKGSLLVIIPSIWMKPDKARTYHFLTSFKIKKLKCLTNTETNRFFSGEAQTPTCYFHLIKESSDGVIDLYDKDLKKYIEYPLKKDEPIPVFGASILKKIKVKENQIPLPKVYKTNMPSKTISLKKNYSKDHPYKNIRTTVLSKLDARVVLEYSNKPMAFYGKKKIVMGHKMYGFPFIDYKGEYGISNRDNYVILSDDDETLERLCEFFSNKLALYLFETTRYRMKYLEKYIFQLLPDITKLDNVPDNITVDSLSDYFKLTDEERKSVKNLHKKEYTFKININ